MRESRRRLAIDPGRRPITAASAVIIQPKNKCGRVSRILPPRRWTSPLTLLRSYKRPPERACKPTGRKGIWPKVFRRRTSAARRGALLIQFVVADGIRWAALNFIYTRR